MAFTDDDLASLSDNFVDAPDTDIVKPRAHERMHGGNAGFSHFERAAPRTAAKLPVTKCRRCRQPSVPGLRFCELHREIRRRESLEYQRRKGVQPWTPGGKGRPPQLVCRRVDVEVALQESMLADALSERAALDRRIARLRSELTIARRTATKRQAAATSPSVRLRKRTA